MRRLLHALCRRASRDQQQHRLEQQLGELLTLLRASEITLSDIDGRLASIEGQRHDNC